MSWENVNFKKKPRSHIISKAHLIYFNGVRNWQFFPFCFSPHDRNRNITLFYPDCGGLRFKLLFNQQVHPRLPLATVSDDLHILFSFEGTVTAGEIFKPNHFVPIVFGVTGGKRKLPQAASQQIRKRSCNVAPVRGTGKDVPTKISSFFYLFLLLKQNLILVTK